MIIRQGSKSGSKVKSPAKTIEQFAKQTRVRQIQWAEQLADAPDNFEAIEREIDQHYRLGAGHLSAAVLAEVTARPEMAGHVETVKENAVSSLKKPQQRPLQVRLLCGLVLFITTSYCAPRRRSKDQGEEEVVGLYPELAALGFGKGCSPALQYKVGRIVALSPSIETAKKELDREGIHLDKKTVRRIAEQLGEQLLELRRRELLAWRVGQLAMGNDFAGRRVAVQIDGGRIRIRENKKRKRQQKRKKGQRGKFSTPWREPKVLTIFEINERGKLTKKHRQPLIDGTLLGKDNLIELVAYHLHCLGAAKADLVVFVCDGAQWIWDRLDWVVERVGLDTDKVFYVLDFYHAAHHIGLALKLLDLPETKRKERYKQLRKHLKSSRYDKVVRTLKRLAKGQPPKSDVWREIRYLEGHGKAGHLQYATFRRRGIPCGSGAVESAIRRVINLRLKSNATYWLQENAEAVFAVRALLLTDRWEETLVRMRKIMREDRKVEWKWKAPDIAAILKTTAKENSSHSETVAEHQDMAITT